MGKITVIMEGSFINRFINRCCTRTDTALQGGHAAPPEGADHG